MPSSDSTGGTLDFRVRGAYDRRGPTLNAIITVSDTAVERAAELDDDRNNGGPMAPRMV